MSTSEPAPPSGAAPIPPSTYEPEGDVVTAAQPVDDEQSDYDYLRDAVIEAFNPADDDAAEPYIMAMAVESAAEFIASLPDACTPEMVEDYDPCPRCRALGRLGDRPLDR